MNSLTDMHGISKKIKKLIPLMPIGISFFLVEVFAFAFLSLNVDTFSLEQLWPLAFGLLWAVVLTCLVRIFPGKSARIVYAVIYLAAVIYAGFQTGYYIMFSEMMWLSEFRYASEGADYASVLFRYPVGWWVGICALIILGILVVWKFPTWKTNRKQACMACAAAVLAFAVALYLPKVVSSRDGDEARSDYKRALSAEAAYEEMFNVHRLYEVCGLYQTLAKDIYANEIIPLTPGYILKQQSAHAEVDAYFSKQIGLEKNQMTGILSGKNIVLVLMESLDDWMVGEDTPTICRLMEEGINFTRFYTPVYGGIRTFNSEFCMNTGSFLSSTGGYAFHYVTNAFDHSLPSLARREGYSTMTFHFNSPEFYSRGEFSAAMGYDAYIWYADYLEWGDEELNRISEKALNADDQVLFDNEGLNDLFFREGGPTLNFIISNAAHLPYKYNEQVSQFGLEKYPEYYAMTGNEEMDCALVKARLSISFPGGWDGMRSGTA